jgi:hypothetical protein
MKGSSSVHLWGISSGASMEAMNIKVFMEAMNIKVYERQGISRVHKSRQCRMPPKQPLQSQRGHMARWPLKCIY